MFAKRLLNIYYDRIVIIAILDTADPAVRRIGKALLPSSVSYREGRRTGEAPKKSLFPAVAWEGGRQQPREGVVS